MSGTLRAEDLPPHLVIYSGGGQAELEEQKEDTLARAV